MTVELIEYNREAGEYERIGIVHEGEYIDCDEEWVAPTSFGAQLDAQGLLEDEEALIEKYNGHHLTARKVDPATLDLALEGTDG